MHESSLFCRTAEHVTQNFLQSLAQLSRMKPDLARCEQVAAEIERHGLEAIAHYDQHVGLSICVMSDSADLMDQAVNAAALAAQLVACPIGHGTFTLVTPIGAAQTCRSIHVQRIGDDFLSLARRVPLFCAEAAEK